MNKALLTGAALLLLAAAAQAKKTPVMFYPGVEGFLPGPNAEWRTEELVQTNDFGEVVSWLAVYIAGTAEKDTLTFTKLAFDKPGYHLGVIVETPLRAVAYKGRDPGLLDYLSVGGLRPLTIRLKGVVCGQVSCFGLRSAQLGGIEDLFQNFEGWPRGTVIKATGQVGHMGVFPEDGRDYGTLYGCFKSIAAGTFGNVSIACVVPKVLVLKAGEPSPGLIRLPAGVNYKAKNVNVAVGE